MFDPFRPAIEPNGFVDADEVRNSRNEAIRSFRSAVRQSDFFVFTLGLTESWFNTAEGYEYPMCPGTAAGEFNSDVHQFRNQEFTEIAENLKRSIELMRDENPELRFILTVSPVPLTATNSGSHVLVATMESKSILRAVAGHVARSVAHVDYFPSYEIINSAVFKGIFFEPNLRSVNPAGVDFVMNHFFSALGTNPIRPQPAQDPTQSIIADPSSDVVCEEELLDAFGKRA